MTSPVPVASGCKPKYLLSFLIFTKVPFRPSLSGEETGLRETTRITVARPSGYIVFTLAVSVGLVVMVVSASVIKKIPRATTLPPAAIGRHGRRARFPPAAWTEAVSRIANGPDAVRVNGVGDGEIAQ